MKYLYMSAVMLISSFSASAQSFSAVSAACKMTTASEAINMEWMQYCDYNSSTAVGVGTQSTSTMLRATTLFKTSTLEKFEGKEISLVAVQATSRMEDVTVFVLRGDDINEAETVTEVKIPQLAKGWNIVRLESPVRIDPSSAMGVGYMAKDNSLHPVAFDGKSVVANTSYLRINNQPYTTSDEAWGNLMIRAFVAGDPTALGYNLALDNFDIPRNVPVGEPIKVTLSLTNSSFETITDFTYELTANGDKKIHTVNLEQPISNNSPAKYVFYTDPVTESTTYDISITKVNGQDNMAVASATKSVVPYDATDAVERYILIEKFTGQNCGYCPGGETSIANAISGMEDNVVRIDHHYGYTKDIFTIEESEKIGLRFNVNSAPNCMMNRTLQEERMEIKNGAGVVFHPGYLTSEMVRNEISRPAFVTVEIEPSYNPSTRTATITLRGKATRDMDGTRLNVCLTQSGYAAYQNSADADWRHNDFPIDFMTAYDGDEIEWSQDGSYERTFSYTIAEKYGKVVADPELMDVVAFVSRWDDDSSEVMNAACKPLIQGGSGIGEALEYNIMPVFNGDSFSLNGSADGIEVYTVGGMRIDNRCLTSGLYIVKVKDATENSIKVYKIAIR